MTPYDRLTSTHARKAAVAVTGTIGAWACGVFLPPGLNVVGALACGVFGWLWALKGDE